MGALVAAFSTATLLAGCSASTSSAVTSAGDGVDGAGGAPVATAGEGAGGAPGQTDSAGATGAGAGATGAGARAGGKVVGDVCGLLTPAEVGAALGLTFGDGEAKDVSGSTATCEWEAQEGGPASGLVALSVEEYDADMWAMSERVTGGRPVADLGDKAMFGFLDILDVKKGDRDFTIEIVLMPPPSNAVLDDAKIRLARLVLERL